jgi:adenosylmethionine-8-amino-7-oxononanoate aminotransferase
VTDLEYPGHDKRHVWHPFTQAQTSPDPIAIRAGRGAVLYAEDGREFLDVISSWWVTLHGHAHPKIAEAVAEQAKKLEQVIFAGFTHRPASVLAQRLTALLPGNLNRVFFSDDGSTAVEVALKMAHQYWRNKGQSGRCKYLAFDGAYHGDTVGAMSAGASSGYFSQWENLMFEVTSLPYPETWEDDEEVEAKEAASLAALDQYLTDHGEETSALIVEPLVQGASGMRMCRPEFLKAVADRLKTADVLLIFDEVMTGFGRTGGLFACLKATVTPDIICLSKGLTGGFLAMSVTVCADEIYEGFLGEEFDRALAHGHSFTANPLGCAAALASMDLLLSDETRADMKSIELLHLERMPRLMNAPGLTHARVMGTIAAIDVDVADAGYTAAIGSKLKEYFMGQGLLMRPLGNVIYLLPPYCISDTQLHTAYDAIEQAAADLL